VLGLPGVGLDGGVLGVDGLPGIVLGVLGVPALSVRIVLSVRMVLSVALPVDVRVPVPSPSGVSDDCVLAQAAALIITDAIARL
jgi:hypothetical protein